MSEKSFFGGKAAPILAACCAILWSCAFPLIKTGLSEFAISSDDTFSQMLFAGVRFIAAGFCVLLISPASGKRSAAEKKSVPILLLFGLVNTALHYLFFYVGLSASTGSRSAVIDSMSTFILIAVSGIVFPDDKFTRRKLFGCILGICGIITIYIGKGDLSGELTLRGDGMMIMSALFSACGGLLTRTALKKTDPFYATGISLAFGGLLLSGSGLFFGGRFGAFTLKGLMILSALIFISAAGFAVYNRLICENPISRIAIFNSLIPLMGIVLSCLFLGEPFDIRYIAAGLLSAAGIFTVNSSSGK